MAKNIKKDQYLEAYNEYSDAIFRYCFYKTSDREKAKDLLQDTFTKTWEYLADGNEIDNIKAFLYRIANNLIIDGFRKKKSLSLDVLQDQGFDPGFDKVESLHNQIDGTLALKMLDQLPENYREVIYMRFVDGFTIKEIAETLKEKENNISVRLHRGMDKIREIYHHEN